MKVPRRTRWVRALAASAVLVSSGCGDPIKQAQLIQENRVLGARVEVHDDPERATPAAGERATVRWLVADPAEPEPLSWAMTVCEAAPVAHGLPRCQATPFGHFESGEPRPTEPTFEFVVPEAAELEDTRLVVLGVVCAAGRARLGASFEDGYCVGQDAQQTLVSLYVTVLRDGGSPNRNPSLGELPVVLDAAPWPALAQEPPLTGCADSASELRRVAAGSGEHRIELEPNPQDREPLADDSLGRSRETLQLSHFCTAGDLERPYSVLEGEAEDQGVDLSWASPGVVPPGGQLVRFYIVARDLRGGVDWTERALCVVPEAGD